MNAQSRPFDHGVLNVPLHKRGNIDSEIDAYKRQQAALAKADAKVKAKELRELCQQAKAIVSALTDEQVAQAAKRLGVTAKQARKKLLSEAHWNPRLVIRVFGEKA